MGRNRGADLGIRPFLDAFQVIPPFVYLVPALGLFCAYSFTATVAAVAYAVPIATKLVADGIRGVSPTTVEAARGQREHALADDLEGRCRWRASPWSWPPTRASCTCCRWWSSAAWSAAEASATSWSRGSRQDQLFGKGLAAGVAIAALGVMLDRIARYAAARYGGGSGQFPPRPSWRGRREEPRWHDDYAVPGWCPCCGRGSRPRCLRGQRYQRRRQQRIRQWGQGLRRPAGSP